MQRYDYLIVGAGMVAANAVEGIRERDAEGTIGILGAEPNGPVTRPALSKKLWTDPDFGYDKIWMQPEQHAGTTLHTDTRVTAIDRQQRTVTTSSGDTFGYGRLLLATGGAPVTIDLPSSEHVRYFRTVEDYDCLRRLADQGLHVAVVGGSYIGTELAAALVQNGCRVTLIHPEDVLGGAMFPPGVADRLHRAYLDAGVTLLGGRKVTGGREEDGSVTLALDDGASLEADAAIFGLGVEPCVALAEEAGLETDGGILVDARLTTADEAIFAAGDVATYPDRILGRWHAEHVDNANQMGQTVGRIMAGSDETYDHTPYFYSNVFDFAWKAVGHMDSSLDIVEDANPDSGRGVYYYLEDGKVAGVLLLNLDADRLDEAREVLADSSPQRVETLVGRIAMD
ncbi:NAD(P)/FAD-dependent oxidoreductase [Salinicola lusitanus]|uniref:NAD(P)/FAD-dependent oxidoreductase n=1 Tax=Salinicola lusitanus TaxID=1949085 RepID=UPI000DA1C3F0|nr:NAD(P)/FAD-dependent oxidoreductase [Salinicola lusitanus]